MPSPVNSSNVVKYLQSLKSIRDRCEQVYAAIQSGHPESRFQVINESDLEGVADYVAKIIKTDYTDPAKDIPPHSRWRHFLPPTSIETEIIQKGTSNEEITKSLLDLFVVSVLLDAGAGDRWKYFRSGYPGGSVGRSEGLAMASMDMFTTGAFSLKDMGHRVDADALINLQLETLSNGLQVNEETNPLIGLQGRLDLLKRLGSVLKDPKNRDFFFDSKDSSYRPGNLINFLLKHSIEWMEVDIGMLWKVVIDGFGGVWPEEGRIKIDGVCLGDVWSSKILKCCDEGKWDNTRCDNTKSDDTKCSKECLVTFHKLSQWLTYSLIEPIEQFMNLKFLNKTQLTGLAEYRNGGLFIDLNVIKVKPEYIKPEYKPSDEVIIQWRALTICLLDQLAPLLRLRLGGLDEETFSLPKMLEGGTWKAGRNIAKEMRPESAGPPIKIISDGTLF